MIISGTRLNRTGAVAAHTEFGSKQ